MSEHWEGPQAPQRPPAPAGGCEVAVYLPLVGWGPRTRGSGVGIHQLEAKGPSFSLGSASI